FSDLLYISCLSFRRQPESPLLSGFKTHLHTVPDRNALSFFYLPCGSIGEKSPPDAFTYIFDAVQALFIPVFCHQRRHRILVKGVSSGLARIQLHTFCQKDPIHPVGKHVPCLPADRTAERTVFLRQQAVRKPAETAAADL